MKTHGQNSPQTVRGLRERRSFRGLLDTRRFQEADLRLGEYYQPFGKGFHKAKNPGGSTAFIVADQTGGRTWSPGAAITLGSNTGAPGESVYGGAPPGRKGGSARTRSPRRRGTPAAESNQYAFGYDGLGSSVATLYADGTFVSTRGTTASEHNFTGIILSDESLIVGDGSALMRSTGGGSLYVWDVEGETTHSYSVPAGWTDPTQLYYQNGFLYWCEIEDTTNDPTFDVRLRRADTDLGNVSTLATFTSPDASVDYGGAPWLTWYTSAFPIDPLAFAVDEDAAILYVDGKIRDVSDNQEWHGLQIRFLLSGSSAFREFTTPELGVDGTNMLAPVSDFPCATLITSFAICEPIDTVQSVLSKADDSSTDAANLWGASDLDGITVSAFNVGTSGSTLQAHSALSGAIYRGVSGATLITSTIDAFDVTPNYPAAMFYFGA